MSLNQQKGYQPTTKRNNYERARRRKCHSRHLVSGDWRRSMLNDTCVVPGAPPAPRGQSTSALGVIHVNKTAVLKESRRLKIKGMSLLVSG